MAEAIYSTDQLGQWYSQHVKNGPDGKPVYERGREPIQIDVPNPKYNPSLPPDPTVNPRTIKVEAVKLTAGDGATIVVEQGPTDAPDLINPNPQPTYIVHSHEDPPVPNAQSAGTIAERNGRTYIIKPDGSSLLTDLPADTKPQNQQIVLAADGHRYLVTVDSQGNMTTVDTKLPAEVKPSTQQLVKGPDGKTYLITVGQDGKITTADTGLPAEPKPNSQQIVEAGDGKRYVVTVDAQGNVSTKDTGLPAKQDITHGHDEGGDYVITMGPNGQPVKTYATTANAPKLGEPPGAPPPDFSPGNVTQNLTDYSNWINQQVNAGTIDPSTATRLMTQRRELAQTAVSEAANIANTATTVYGHQASERNADVGTANARLGASTSGFVNVLQAIQAGARAQPKGSDAAARAFTGLLNLQIEHAKNFGGLTDVPRTPVPASVQPYLTVQLPGGHTMQIVNPNAAPTTPSGQAAPVVGPQAPPLQQPPVVTPGVGTPSDPNAMASANASGFGSAPSYQSISPAATAAAAPEGQIPPHIAAMADSKPTGNAMADLEMAMTAAGMSPAAIAEARQRFLQGQLAQMTVGGGMALPGGQSYALPPIQG